MASIIAHSGIVRLNRKELEKLKAAREKVHISLTGLLVLPKDIPPKLADETIGSLSVRGFISASNAVKSVLRRKNAGV